MQELFELLPRLKLDSSGAPTCATDEAVLREIAAHAQASGGSGRLGQVGGGRLHLYLDCRGLAIPGGGGPLLSSGGGLVDEERNDLAARDRCLGGVTRRCNTSAPGRWLLRSAIRCSPRAAPRSAR
jgi:hypothetical protein